MQRDEITIAGPDAVTFLQGQLSQDVAALAEQQQSYSFLLDPQGKVVAWGRLTRTAPDAVAFDVDPGFGAAALARLNRFKLRTKAELTLHEQVERPEFDWPGLEPGPPETYEARRIAAGLPSLGREIDEHTIPAELGQAVIDRSVSFTKGCYTGQELVARVDSRGSNTPRKLRRVGIAAGLPTIPAELAAEGHSIGVLTSVAALDDGRAVGLALVRRDAPAEAVAVTVDGCAAVVEPLDQPASDRAQVHGHLRARPRFRNR